MKKKLLCAFLTSAILVTSFATAAFAKPAEDASTTGKQKIEQVQTRINELKGDIEELRQELKLNHKDKESRILLIREIVQLRKDNNNKDIPIFFKGKELETDAPPVIKYNRILIPVRAVTEALGATVDWDADAGVATITKSVYSDVYQDGKEIVIVIDLNAGTATVDGEEVTLDAKAEISNNRTMVPMRFIAETFKQYVEWDAESGSAIIEDDEDEED